MKDRTSKQCFFKELHCSFSFICTSLFLLYLIFGVWMGLRLWCIFVFMGMNAEAHSDTNNHLSLEVLKTKVFFLLLHHVKIFFF